MFDKIEMTPEMARKHILGSIDGDTDALTNLIDAVKTWANCHEADVSPEGDIWICNPQQSSKARLKQEMRRWLTN